MVATNSACAAYCRDCFDELEGREGGSSRVRAGWPRAAGRQRATTAHDLHRVRDIRWYISKKLTREYADGKGA
jgi:hypothetical protein